MPVVGPLSEAEPSAAQNGPLIQTCKNCGAVNGAHAESCCFCDARLVPGDEAPAAVSDTTPAEGNLAVAVKVDWRREVSKRLEAYRARRDRQLADDTQPALPSSAGGAAAEPARERAIVMTDKPTAEVAAPTLTPAPEDDSATARGSDATPVERIEIAVSQPELNFAAAETHRNHPSSTLLPVADLAERQRAGLLDAVFLAFSYAIFLTLFRTLGGRFSFAKFDVIVYVATLVLFYAQYFMLFTALGGSTPGMLLRGLRVVRFDGSEPTPQQLLWRSFGYLLSGGTALLGFLWALWDEDHLTWQDRISQTYLTPAGPLAEGHSSRAPS